MKLHSIQLHPFGAIIDRTYSLVPGALGRVAGVLADADVDATVRRASPCSARRSRWSP